MKRMKRSVSRTMASQETDKATQDAATLNDVVDETAEDAEDENMDVDVTCDVASNTDENDFLNESNAELDALSTEEHEDLSAEIDDVEVIGLQEVTRQLLEQTERIAKQNDVGTEADATMSTKLEELVATQQQLQKDFQEKLKYDEHKEQMIDTLHRELQQYKDDMIKSTIKPLVNDLIMVNDNIYKLVDNLRAAEDALDPEKLLEHMEFITTDIDDVLFRQGIEPYTCTEEKVNLRKQSIFQTVPINDPSKEKHIAKQVRKGYEWDEQIVRKELVSVYVHDDSIGEQVSTDKEATEEKQNEGADQDE